MNIEELLQKGKKELIKNNIEDSYIISKLLILYIFNIQENKYIINKYQSVDNKKEIEYMNYINEIIQGKPLQYITNKQEFMKLDFYIDSNVLIPQPDTEILVEKVIEIANKNINTEKLKILDICTGSGAIGISLAKYIKNSRILLSDISKEAIQIAKTNAKNNKVEDNIDYLISDMYDKIEEKFDIIVSNPPYIESNIIETLSKQVQSEPKLALDGGQDGLKFYRNLIENSYKYLNKNGYLCMEIGYNQKEEILKLIKDKYKNIETIKDLEGNNRVVICQKEE